MEIYLDSNATTAVLPCAQRAALAVMANDFGNPSSTHCAGLRSRAVLDEVRATAKRVMRASRGRIFFTSGATEGIHTAVLSALVSLRGRHAAGHDRPNLLLYGATEHKAVPEALRHWNELLGLGLELQAIPVGRDGRHDLGWLRAHAKRAGLVCTMAANNETGVISDLDGIAEALEGSSALWMVDSVQALGKLPMRLDDLPIDYAPCSGHKLFAPKGVGLLYVRDGAPFTPLLTGGGQEAGLRAGTENMAGIAALGAVLSAVESKSGLQSWEQLSRHRHQLVSALKDAFPSLELNAPVDTSLPTTLNFSVPGLSSRLLLNLFDAAGLRVSGGSACSSSKALPSYVLEAMGLPEWQTASGVRLSIDATVDDRLIEEACRRIRACGASLRDARPADTGPPPEPEGTLKPEVPVVMSPSELLKLAGAGAPLVVVDVREAHEQALGLTLALDAPVPCQAVPLSTMAGEMPKWLAQPETPVVFFCRSGGRSAQAARALRRAGHPNAWSLEGGLALWPCTSTAAVQG